MKHARLRTLQLLSVILLTLLAACSSVPNTEQNAEQEQEIRLEQLLQDMGGPAELAAFLADTPEAEAREVLERYNLGLVVYSEPDGQDFATQGLRDCPVRFAQNLRGKIHKIGLASYIIDQEGRPRWASKDFPPMSKAKRDPDCQQKVGNLGGPGYDGGHLIGANLGGWGRRANLVPQNKNFNRGNWASIERQVKRCPANNVEGSYLVRTEYPSKSALVPNKFTATVSIETSGAPVSKSANFTNKNKGGRQGPTQRKQMNDWLRGNGCR